MDNRLRQAKELVASRIKPRFPITSISSAVRLIVDLLDDPSDDPQLAVVAILFHLVHGAHSSPQPQRMGKRKNSAGTRVTSSSSFEMSGTPGGGGGGGGGGEAISWSQFEGIWRALVEVVQKEFPLGIGSVGAGNDLHESVQDLRRIYGWVGRVFKVDREARATAGGVLGKFIGAAAAEDRVKLKVGLAEFKVVSLIVAQLVGLDDVHLCLTECLCYLAVGNLPGLPNVEDSFVPVLKEEDGLLPVKCLPSTNTGRPITPDDLWVCSKRQFVRCNRHMEVAYMCCNLDGDDIRKPSKGPISVFQCDVLAHLHHAGHLNMYPAATATYGSLLSLLSRDQEESVMAERTLLEAIRINQESFRNAYLSPYCLLFNHLNSQEHKIAAILPAFLASDVVKEYRYVVSLDTRLNDELLHRMASNLDHIISPKQQESAHSVDDPAVAALVLGFIDNVCLWEEKSSIGIWHSTWSSKLIHSCLRKLSSGPLHHVMLHASTDSMAAAVASDSAVRYVPDMLHALRTGPLPLPRSDSDPLTVLPSEPPLTEDFCRFALEIFVNWPPMRLDTLSDDFTDKDRMSSIGRLPDRTESEADYDDFIEMLCGWPCCPSVSDGDLKRLSGIRPVNPLYQLCSKQVFPFLDMGPPDIPVYCFDYEKIKREVRAPRPGTPESRVMYQLQQRLLAFAGHTRTTAQPVRYSHVLLRSQKMLNVRPLLGQERFNQSEIALKLEGSAAGVLGGPKEKRDRRPSTRCLTNGF
ncbi:hypothetical protein BV898_10546 [Hypsibius exemplaris]|uniref:Menin n=1 Tax=Hypsibius exemplaris TaxID=2072580 RepID=A0A1W0WJC0_HYPEX|nr:hypothetical protein BV898_10546 [Hypsibius exemplaris]